MPAQICEGGKRLQALFCDVRSFWLGGEHQGSQRGEGLQGMHSSICARLPAAAVQLRQIWQLAYERHACSTHGPSQTAPLHTARSTETRASEA